MDKTTFVMYLKWREQIELLSDDACGRLFKGLFSYLCTGEIPELSGLESMAFSFIRAQIDQDTEKWESECKSRSEAGRKGGFAKASKAKQKLAKASTAKQDLAKASTAKQRLANVADNEYEYDSEYEYEKEVSITPHKSPLGDDLFERFWAAYPRKTAKRNALKAFEKLNVTEALLTEMLAALDWQRQSEGWTKDGGQFIPHPATWLNGRRWEDEKPAQAKTNSNPFLAMLDEMGDDE